MFFNKESIITRTQNSVKSNFKNNASYKSSDEAKLTLSINVSEEEFNALKREIYQIK